jgi:hypothetical protein
VPGPLLLRVTCGLPVLCRRVPLLGAIPFVKLAHQQGSHDERHHGHVAHGHRRSSHATMVAANGRPRVHCGAPFTFLGDGAELLLGIGAAVAAGQLLDLLLREQPPASRSQFERGLYQPVVHGLHGRLHAVLHAKLGQNARNVVADRGLAHEKRLGDFGVGLALGHQSKDVQLACR